MNRLRMRAVWTIAKREYLARVRSRSFLISTISVPALMIVVSLVIGLTTANQTGRAPVRKLRIVVVSGDSRLPGLIQECLNQWAPGDFAIEPGPAPSSDVQSQMIGEVRAGMTDAVLWLDESALASGRASYVGRDQRVATSHWFVGAAVSQSLARLRLEDKHAIARDETDRIFAPMTLEAQVLPTLARQPASKLGAGTVALIMMMVLLISLVTYGAMVMRGVLEEKSTRIPEVLLCVASSDELMAGKISGIGAVGLTQIGIWMGFFAVVVGLGASSGAVARELIRSINLSGAMVAWFIVFYILGYLLYSAMFAALGAAFVSIDEAQQWTLPLMLPLLISSWLVVPVAGAPNSSLAVIVSMIPLMSPVLMTTRIATGGLPLWQIGLSIALLGATIAVMISVCARIYRVGILMYGKPPRPSEILRWLRYS